MYHIFSGIAVTEGTEVVDFGADVVVCGGGLGTGNVLSLMMCQRSEGKKKMRTRETMVRVLANAERRLERNIYATFSLLQLEITIWRSRKGKT